MTIKLKALSLALVAACAMSAIVASSASASGEKFTSDRTHTILSASAITNQVFTTTAGTIECTAMSVDEATMATGVESAITAKPTYSGCIGISVPVTFRVTPTSCDYRFTSEIPAGREHAEVHIECTTAGDEIDWEAKFLGVFLPCITVPAQTPTGGGVTYANSGTDHIKVKATVTGIKYTEDMPCGNNTNVNDGTYSGEVTVSGKEPGGNRATLSYS